MTQNSLEYNEAPDDSVPDFDDETDVTFPNTVLVVKAEIVNPGKTSI